MEAASRKKRLSRREQKLLKKRLLPPLLGGAGTKTSSATPQRAELSLERQHPIATEHEQVADPDSPQGEQKRLRKKRARVQLIVGSLDQPSGLGAPTAVAKVELGEASAKRRKTAKNRRKQAPLLTVGKNRNSAEAAFSTEVSEIMRSLSDANARGTLSDRLNPTDPCFDKKLKQRWTSFSKKEREAIVECDKQRLAKVAEAAVYIEHPFATTEDDHCETSADAYADIAPILRHLAETLGTSPTELRIYDPYFCSGAVIGHLNKLGFETVHNKCEDFYAVLREDRVPRHDVVVTNPPYSGNHVERLLQWVRSNGKPFLLLMPGYCCVKSYFQPALSDPSTLLYLLPRKRYVYWTPRRLRTRDKVQSQHVGAGGHRTSPFVSLWYIDLNPAISSKKLLGWWRRNCGNGQTLCLWDALPPVVFENEKGSVVES